MIQSDIVFLDIETLPTIDRDLIAAVEADVSPPGQIEKKESIEKWWAEDGPEAKREAVRKTSLDGGTGRLAALSWAWGDGTIMGAHTALDGAHSVEQERRLLTGFFEELERFHAENRVPPTLVGHNIAGFDIRWLWKRSIVLGIRPPHWWPVDSRPWDHAKIQDTMLMWEGSKGRISQDRLARTLGIRGKGAIDGSQVADVWEEGRFKEIREYNVDDVRTVRKVWCRIVGEDAPAEDDVVEETEVVATGVKEPVAVVQPNPGAVELPVEIVTEPTVEPVVEAPARKRQVVPVFLRDVIREEELA